MDTRVGIPDCFKDPGQHQVSTLGDEDSELSEDSADGVDSSGSCGHPARPEAMETAQCLLVHGLQRDRMDLLVSDGLRRALASARSVLLPVRYRRTSWAGRSWTVWPSGADLPAPVMCRPACFHENDRGGRCAQPSHETRSREPVALPDATGLVGDGDLEDGLCHIDGDSRRVHVDSSLSVGTRCLQAAWHYDAVKSRGRSPSHHIHLTRWTVTALAEKHRRQDHRPGLPGPRRPQLAGDANVVWICPAKE